MRNLGGVRKFRQNRSNDVNDLGDVETTTIYFVNKGPKSVVPDLTFSPFITP